jgi:ligand-binding SRPBCC domain-containing protein
MSIIYLQTNIKAPIAICFDLSRSVELHILSTEHTKEKAVAGKVSGLFNIEDTVTWRARHFGIYQKLTVRITGCIYPCYFEDQTVSGTFKSFTHKHYFKVLNGSTLMEDMFEYEVPYGIVGKVFNKIILYNYMKQLLLTRNKMIKQVAESGDWQNIIETPSTY